MLSAEERRDKIKKTLSESSEPLTGSELAAETKVSRQVVVQDMAVLRASGVDVQAGPRGYRLFGSEINEPRMVIALQHKPEETEEELTLLVDAGVEVLDVIVEHEIYGEIRGSLHLAGRDDVRRFMERVKQSNAVLLSQITGGIHLHTITARSRDRLDRAVVTLRARGFLVE